MFQGAPAADKYKKKNKNYNYLLWHVQDLKEIKKNNNICTCLSIYVTQLNSF